MNNLVTRMEKIPKSKTEKDQTQDSKQNEQDSDFELFQEQKVGYQFDQIQRFFLNYKVRRIYSRTQETKEQTNQVEQNRGFNFNAQIPQKNSQNIPFQADFNKGGSLDCMKFVQMTKYDTKIKNFQNLNQKDQQIYNIKRPSQTAMNKHYQRVKSFNQIQNYTGKESSLVEDDEINQNPKYFMEDYSSQSQDDNEDYNNNYYGRNNGENQYIYDNQSQSEEGNDFDILTEEDGKNYFSQYVQKNNDASWKQKLFKKRNQSDDKIELTIEDQSKDNKVVGDFKKSGVQKQSRNNVEVINIEEEEKQKNSAIPNQNTQVNDYIELSEDSEVNQSNKMNNPKENDKGSNIAFWSSLSKNNLQLRQQNSRYMQEVNFQRSYAIKKSKTYYELLENLKKKQKHLIKSNASLLETNKENEKRLQQVTQQLKDLTSELVEKQKQTQELQSKLTKKNTEQIKFQMILENKENEIEHLKNSIKICEDTIEKISQKKVQFDNFGNQQKSASKGTNHKTEIQQKLNELNQQLGQKPLEITSNDSMFQIFNTLHHQIMIMLQEKQQSDQFKNKFERQEKEIKDYLQKLIYSEEELEKFKKDNDVLIKVESQNQSTIQHLQAQVKNAKQIEENNNKLHNQVNTLQKQLSDKQKQFTEQESLNQIKVDNLLELVNNSQKKNILQQSFEELMNTHEIVTQQLGLKNNNQLQQTNDPVIKQNQTNFVKIQNKELTDESIFLNNVLNKLFNWEIEYVEDQPSKFNLISKSNHGKRQIQVNLTVNPDGEIIMENKQQLQKNVRKLLRMLNSDEHVSSLKSCVDNFWLITALQLKDYLRIQESIIEEQEYKDQIEKEYKDNIELELQPQQSSKKQSEKGLNIQFSSLSSMNEPELPKKNSKCDEDQQDSNKKAITNQQEQSKHKMLLEQEEQEEQQEQDDLENQQELQNQEKQENKEDIEIKFKQKSQIERFKVDIQDENDNSEIEQDQRYDNFLDNDENLKEIDDKYSKGRSKLNKRYEGNQVNEEKQVKYNNDEDEQDKINKQKYNNEENLFDEDEEDEEEEFDDNDDDEDDDDDEMCQERCEMGEDTDYFEQGYQNQDEEQYDIEDSYSEEEEESGNQEEFDDENNPQIIDESEQEQDNERNQFE